MQAESSTTGFVTIYFKKDVKISAVSYDKIIVEKHAKRIPWAGCLE